MLCIFIIPALIRLGIMDTPVQRSAHHTPIPKGGGIAIITAFLGGMAFHSVLQHTPFTLFQLCLVIGTLLLCVVSWLDDIRPFAARYKLSAQALAGIIIALGCHPSSSLFLIPMVATTIILTNTINFMDGLNGLAAGVIALTSFFMAGMNIVPFDLLLLGVSLVGFLPFNFPNARIFMGDAGSQPCAFILSGVGMTVFQPIPHFPYIAGEFWLLPCLLNGMLWDVFFTLARRTRAKESLAQAHRGHLYQLAVRTNIPAPAVTLIHWGFTIWGGISFCLPSMPECLIALSLPQIMWTLTVTHRARRHLTEKW
nr:UDP-phosphate alpha N-acetylglucosaminyltransferase [Saccharibacter sp. 17.LH.SD]